ncbi:hypothetical protein EON82_24850, partial [bacterium]
GLEFVSIPDLVLVGERVRVLDLKSGAMSEEAKEEADRQLDMYGLVEWARRAVQAEDVELQVVWLADEARSPVRTLGLEGVASALAASARSREDLNVRTQALSRGVTVNEAFESRASARRCSQCPYRPLCPEGAEVTNHLPMVPLIRVAAGFQEGTSGH